VSRLCCISPTVHPRVMDRSRWSPRLSRYPEACAQIGVQSVCATWDNTLIGAYSPVCTLSNRRVESITSGVSAA
jgi:hypothetical protein